MEDDVDIDYYNVFQCGVVAFESSFVHMDTLRASKFSIGMLLLHTNNTQCHLLLLLAAVISQCGATEYYVKPTEPTTTSCPGHPCLTLNQYTNNSSYYIRFNTVFMFLPGKHIMERPLEIRDVENVTLNASKVTDHTYPILVAQFATKYKHAFTSEYIDMEDDVDID